MTKEQIELAVKALDEIDGKDPESAHAKADDVLFSVLPPEILQAYGRLQDRCSWWAAA